MPSDPKDAISTILEYLIEADPSVAAKRSKLREDALKEEGVDESSVFIRYSMLPRTQRGLALADNDNPVLRQFGLQFWKYSDAAPTDASEVEGLATADSADSLRSDDGTAQGQASASADVAQGSTDARLPAPTPKEGEIELQLVLAPELMLGGQQGLQVVGLFAANWRSAKRQPWWDAAWMPSEMASETSRYGISNLEMRIAYALYGSTSDSEAAKVQEAMQGRMLSLQERAAVEAETREQREWVDLEPSNVYYLRYYCVAATHWRCRNCNTINPPPACKHAANSWCKKCSRSRRQVGVDVKRATHARRPSVFASQLHTATSGVASAESLAASAAAEAAEAEEAAANYSPLKLVSTPRGCLVFLNLNGEEVAMSFVRRFCEELLIPKPADPPLPESLRASSGCFSPAIRPHRLCRGDAGMDIKPRLAHSRTGTEPAAAAAAGAKRAVATGSATATTTAAAASAGADTDEPWYALDTIVAFGARHYTAYVRYSETEAGVAGGWVLFNDSVIKPIGDIRDVADHLARNRMMPTVLHFQRPPTEQPAAASGSSSSASSLSAPVAAPDGTVDMDEARRRFTASYSRRFGQTGGYELVKKPHPPWPVPALAVARDEPSDPHAVKPVPEVSPEVASPTAGDEAIAQRLFDEERAKAAALHSPAAASMSRPPPPSSAGSSGPAATSIAGGNTATAGPVPAAAAPGTSHAAAVASASASSSASLSYHAAVVRTVPDLLRSARIGRPAFYPVAAATDEALRWSHYSPFQVRADATSRLAGREREWWDETPLERPPVVPRTRLPPHWTADEFTRIYRGPLSESYQNRLSLLAKRARAPPAGERYGVGAARGGHATGFASPAPAPAPYSGYDQYGNRRRDVTRAPASTPGTAFGQHYHSSAHGTGFGQQYHSSSTGAGYPVVTGSGIGAAGHRNGAGRSSLGAAGSSLVSHAPLGRAPGTLSPMERPTTYAAAATRPAGTGNGAGYGAELGGSPGWPRAPYR